MDKQIINEIQSHFIPSNAMDAAWKGVVSILSLIFSYLFDLALPHQAIFLTIIGVCFADWILGIAAAVHNKIAIESRKLVKVFVYILVYSLLLLVLAQIEAAFVTMGWIVEGVMMPIVLVQFVSVLKNVSRLGLISDGMLNSFLKKIDKYKDERDSDNTAL